MKDEVTSAVGFLTNILRSSDNVNEAQTRQFGLVLSNLLCKRYLDHWFPEKPFKGSGYRCIRMNHKIDPLILQAGQVCGLNQGFLATVFPPELTLWVDPMDVSFRIGENGSVGILYNSESVTPSSHQSEAHQNPTSQQPRSTEGVHHTNPKSVSSFKSCKDQFSMAMDNINYQQLAGFISS